MKGSLSLYLKRAGVTLGPSLRSTRHSDLSLLKSWLCGQAISFGYKAHNNFGRAVHLKFLLRKDGNFKLTNEERLMRIDMIKALDAHPVVRSIMMACPTREKRRPCVLNNVKIKFTPDAHGTKIASDLKTTVCSTIEDFIVKAFEYGYFRQGKQYGTALKIGTYWIIGIQKKRGKPKVFLVLIQDHKDYMDYVEQELAFLLYFYKHYGNPNHKRKKSLSLNQA